MRVDDRILKNVTFVGLESDRGFTPLGTGFLGILAVADMHLCFLITAAHVIEKIRGDTFSIRVNLTSGGCVTTKIKKSDQIVHTDPNADIAMFSVTVEPSIHDVSLMPLDRSMSDQLRTTWKPGVGDEVVIVGAYTTHHGLMRNIPVARMGNIAQMPEEPVRTHAGHVVAYLVETRSLAGLSGSPVYLHPPAVWREGNEIKYMNDPQYIPVGVVTGTHTLVSRQDQIQVSEQQVDDFDEVPLDIDAFRGTGFSVVVPIERVFDIIERPDFVAAVQQKLVDYYRESGFVQLDAGQPK